MPTDEPQESQSPEIGYHWHPIEDLPEDWPSLADPELRFWRTAWLAKRDVLIQRAEVQQFMEGLQREWAIETGLVENLYFFGPGVTQTLIERGFLMDILESSHVQGDPETIQHLLQDQLQALHLVMDYVAQARPLSQRDILDLHKILTEHQDTAPGVFQGQRTQIELRKGEYKRWPNNPTRADGKRHEYCPPEQVQPQMEQLLHWHLEHLERRVSPEVEAAWLHHRFVQIHPFQDGNGRVARCLASMVLLKGGGFPLIVPFARRDAYYDCLQSADAGELLGLVQYFETLQREAILSAMETEGKLKSQPLREVIQAGIELLLEHEELAKTHKEALAVAEGLWVITQQETASIIEQLRTALGNGRFGFRSEEFEQQSPDRGFHQHVLRDFGHVGVQLPYFRQVQLSLQGPYAQATVFASLLPSDTQFIGRVSAQVYVQVYDRINPQIQEPEAVGDGRFEFSYREPSAEVEARFTPWLSRALARGLAVWFAHEREGREQSQRDAT